MKILSWAEVSVIASLTLASHTAFAAVVAVPATELQALLNQGKITSCETFCVQTVEVFDDLQQSASINIIATNSLTVSAELNLSVTVTNIAPGSASVNASIPAQTSYSVYQGNIISKPSAWKHSVSYAFYPGAIGAVHDNNAVYELPWRRGDKHPSLNANPDYFEFSMPDKTPVLAARAGRVVGIKQKKDIRSFSSTQNHDANEIFILHPDQTIGAYRNLSQNGALVALGAEVQSGQKIALSGQTGYALNPMLTFYVTTPPVSGASDLIDINFMTAEGVFSYFASVGKCKYTAVHENSTIDPDLSFENDPGLGSSGTVTQGDNTSTGGSNSDGACSNDTGTDTTTPDGGENTGGSTTPDTTTPDTTTPGNAGGGQAAASDSGGGGGGSTSPIVLLVLTALYRLRRKGRRV